MENLNKNFESGIKPRRLVMRGVEVSSWKKFEDVDNKGINERLDELERRIKTGRSVSLDKAKVKDAIEKAKATMEEIERMLDGYVDNNVIKKIGKLSVPKRIGGSEVSNIYRTYIFDKVEDALKTRANNGDIDKESASKIMEEMLHNASEKGMGAKKALYGGMRMIKYVDFVPQDIKKDFINKYKREELAQKMEKNGFQGVKIGEDGIITIEGKQYQIENFETLVGSSMLEIDSRFLQKFILKNFLFVEGKNVALAQMENGCEGNLVALKMVEYIPPKPVVTTTVAPPPTPTTVIKPEPPKPLEAKEYDPTVLNAFGVRMEMRDYFLDVDTRSTIPRWLNPLHLPRILGDGVLRLIRGSDYVEKQNNLEYDPPEWDKEGDDLKYSEDLPHADKYFEKKRINTLEDVYVKMLGLGENSEIARQYLKSLGETEKVKLNKFITKWKRIYRLYDLILAAKERIALDKSVTIKVNEKFGRKLDKFGKDPADIIKEAESNIDQHKKELGEDEKLSRLAKYVLDYQVVDVTKSLRNQDPVSKILDNLERESYGTAIVDFERDEKNTDLLGKNLADMTNGDWNYLGIYLPPLLEKNNIAKLDSSNQVEVDPKFKNFTLRDAINYLKYEVLNISTVEMIDKSKMKLGNPALTFTEISPNVASALIVLGLVEGVRDKEKDREELDSISFKGDMDVAVNRIPRSKNPILKLLIKDDKKVSDALDEDIDGVDNDKLVKDLTLGEVALILKAKKEDLKNGIWIERFGEKQKHQIPLGDDNFEMLEEGKEMFVKGKKDSLSIERFDITRWEAMLRHPSPFTHVIRLLLLLTGTAIDFEAVEKIDMHEILDEFKIGKEEALILQELAKGDKPISEKIAMLLFSQHGTVKQPGEKYHVPVGFAHYHFPLWIVRFAAKSAGGGGGGETSGYGSGQGGSTPQPITPDVSLDDLPSAGYGSLIPPA